MRTALLAVLVLALAPGAADAQAPTGVIAGVVTDSSGAAIPAVHVVVTNKDTGLERSAATTPSGDYSAPALPVGVYKVIAEAEGFQRLVKEDVVVEAGNTTTFNMTMKAGKISETVTVSGAEAPQMRNDSITIGGVITRLQIASLPLNGRSALNLSTLEPGALQPTRSSNNRTLVTLLGAPAGQGGGRTLVTVDGGSVMEIGNGGSAMGFSQEVVQEFQISTVNLDLSTGMTASGTITIVTRSGTNQWSGSAFMFFRDHTLSAYPGLEREREFNPDPFFQRSQFGMEAGGPIHKDRVFFFGTWEHTEQHGVVSTELHAPDFAPLSGIFPSPTDVNQFSGRADVRLTDKHFVFFRYSQEGISLFGPTGLTQFGSQGLPSAWRQQPAQTSQSIVGLTSLLRANVVNDLRVSYFLVNSAEESPTAADCGGCFGLGAMYIMVPSDLFIGSATTTSVRGRRYELNDVAAWQKGSHQIRFGGDVEVSVGGRTDLGNESVTMTLFSPDEVRKFNASPATPASRRIPLPDSFLTVDEILQLPVKQFTVGIGDATVPQKDFGLERIAPLVHVFYQDAWHLRRRLTVDYGLGWTYDAPLNYDLAKPAYLAPILGESGLGPTRKNWHNFSPSAGFAWGPREDGKTLIRGGAGIYYDFGVPFSLADPERVALGPRGVGRSNYPNTAIANPLTGIPGVPAGMLLNFRGIPTLFTGAALRDALPAIRADLTEWRGDPNNRDFSVTNIEADKTGLIIASDLPPISATHASLGLQHQIARGFVISADVVFRQFSHLGVQPDLNHFAKTSGPVPGPVIPQCSTPAQRKDPEALCSVGPIRVFSAIGRATYQGLLLRVDKRFSHRWQFLGSYAYSTNAGTNGPSPTAGIGFNNDAPLSNYGPLDRDIRHILSLSGLVQLPRQFQLGVSVTYNSKPPFSAYFGSLDLDGDGTTGDLLPGTKVNQFNRGLGKEDLRRLVDEFNGKYANTTDAQGRFIPSVTLPADFEFGDRLLTAALRLSWTRSLNRRVHLTLIGEVFNLCNTANFSGRSGDLSHPESFGQATSFVTQVFGSGGPRSWQIAARLGF
jgi:hypothetical protein